MKELLDRLEEQARAIERLKADLDAAHRMLVMQDEDKEKQAPGYGGDGRWWPNSAITTVEAKVDPHAQVVQNGAIRKEARTMTIRLLLPVTLDLHPDKLDPPTRVSMGLVADAYEAECRRIWPTGSVSGGAQVWEEVEPSEKPRGEGWTKYTVDGECESGKICIALESEFSDGPSCSLHLPMTELPRPLGINDIITAADPIWDTENIRQLVGEWTHPRVNPLNRGAFQESGPGISSLPEKRESLAFLDEDLLCEDE